MSVSESLTGIFDGTMDVVPKLLKARALCPERSREHGVVFDRSWRGFYFDMTISVTFVYFI